MKPKKSAQNRKYDMREHPESIYQNTPTLFHGGSAYVPVKPYTGRTINFH